ncbi:MAG TPA: coniferyl aldehyde dehydrogenase [Casimicrobiaceae bacterium]|nr:coniferyl aldehyde dehydrogenase [Casimicrobiaceae bacterium]
MTLLFRRQREAFAADRYPDVAARRDRLERIVDIVRRHERALVAAIDRDFGHRSAHETRIAELYIVAAEARHAIRHLSRWMKPRRITTPWHLLPAKARIVRQPLGVAGVISPWNYPVQLALAPVVAALAAGNRVMLKPSEITPATSALLADLVEARFRDDELAVVSGDASVGRAFAALPFDHLFFTGSTAVGRQVALAAAANLTPVTLELGGKSPALFDGDADLATGVTRLMAGKLLNAGQTCIAPDYALVPKSRVDEFVVAAQASVRALYPDVAANADYSSIIDARHYARLITLVEDARGKGARIVALGDEAGDSGYPRRLVPTLVVGVTDDMAIMREEIFGPLLPVEAYASLDEAIAKINARPHPLAMYWFGGDAVRRAKALRETLAGGVTVNDTLLHFAHPGLPFGGVGASGSGVYHGEYGFATFSSAKPVYFQARYAPTRLLQPPYGAMFERVLTLLERRNG